MAFDKEALFKPRLPEADVDVEGLGTIRVRGLSRAEAMQVQNLNGVAQVERAMLAMGMVEPKLTEGEAREWQEASIANEIEPVANKIAELSGMTENAAKDAYKEFESDPDSEFRVLPGTATLDVGRTAEG